MKWEGEVKQALEDILDEYFPNGDQRRGQALMLFAMAMSYVRKTIKAFGGCDKCYGKGYGTQTLNIHGAADPEMREKGFDEAAPTMVFCGCDRGQQLERLFQNGGRL